MDNNSLHYSIDRKIRNDLIDNVIGNGNIVDSFVVDRGHPNGSEIHSVTDTGIIIIKNKNTDKLITKLVGRPKQIRELYKSNGKIAPKYIISLAYKHNAQDYNHV